LDIQSEKRSTIDFIFIITEDDDGRRSFLETFEKVDHLSLLFNVFDLLYDVQISGPSSTDVNDDWLDETVFGEVSDSFRHSSGEEEGLSLTLEEAHDIPDVVLKAHVDHPIGLVQTQIGAVVQVELALL
jgi:hypothetical protein